MDERELDFVGDKDTVLVKVPASPLITVAPLETKVVWAKGKNNQQGCLVLLDLFQHPPNSNDAERRKGIMNPFSPRKSKKAFV